MQTTSIEWTDVSANLLKYRDASGKIVWHCEKTSPGCAHCYAEALAHRYGKGGPFAKSETPKVTPFFDENEATKILRSKKLAGKRVFIDDMTDLFGDWVPDEIINQHFDVFVQRPDVTFQILTKRAARMRDYMRNGMEHPNVWLAVSIEDQQRADERIPHLLNTPAAVRFLSVEPLLGPIKLDRLQSTRHFPGGGAEYAWESCLNGKRFDEYGGPDLDAPRIDWVIIGGESGGGARPFDVLWARNIRAQCLAANIPVFVKQLGGHVIDHDVTAAHSFPESECWPTGTKTDGHRVLLKDRKGGDMKEWLEDLRVRQMPEGCGR